MKNYWISRVLETRKYGHTYLHVARRADFTSESYSESYGEIVFSYNGYGRSLQSGGHKYKVYAHYIYNQKPVPTKILRSILNTTPKP